MHVLQTDDLQVNYSNIQLVPSGRPKAPESRGGAGWCQGSAKARPNIANFPPREAWPYVEMFNSLPVLASRLKETSFPRQAPILLDVVNHDVQARRPISPTLL